MNVFDLSGVFCRDCYVNNNVKLFCFLTSFVYELSGLRIWRKQLNHFVVCIQQAVREMVVFSVWAQMCLEAFKQSSVITFSQS